MSRARNHALERRLSLAQACKRALPGLGLAVGAGALSVANIAWADDTHVPAALGRHLHGISDEDFEFAKAEFLLERTPNEGIGPIFNGVACGNCHHAGAPGGAGDADDTVLRFGRFATDGTFDALGSKGGSLLQFHTLGTWTNRDGNLCQVPEETVPSEATVTTRRLPPPLFGLGLVDAMPDSFFINLAASQPESVRGTIFMAAIHLPDPKDPSQTVNGSRVGRFSWKDAVPSVTEFAAAAYLNEMGVTTTHCVRGTTIKAFSSELAPNGVAVPLECQDNLPGVDFGVASCNGDSSELEFHVAEFSKFITFLAPPPAEEADGAGQKLFQSTGCASCHTADYKTPPQPFNGVPGNYAFHPYSDYLLHDMGSLGDRIGNQGESLETTRMIRTAPLWGNRFRSAFLHDGRASDLRSAVLAHDGQAAASAAAFAALPEKAKRKLLDFVATR